MASTTFVDGETLIEASWLNDVNTAVYTPGTVTAASITNVPAGNIAATNVQAAINELDTEKQPLDAQLTTLAGITAQQATDLASVSTFIGTVLNDIDAPTARTTLDAAQKTSSLTGTAPATGDYLHGTDTSAVNAEVKFLVSDIVALANSIGVSQTWQNLSASRALSTNYTNSTGKPIQVSVYCASATANTFSTLTVDGVAIAKHSQASGVAGSTIYGIIPNGSIYSVAIAGATPTFLWAELR